MGLRVSRLLIFVASLGLAAASTAEAQTSAYPPRGQVSARGTIIDETPSRPGGVVAVAGGIVTEAPSPPAPPPLQFLPPSEPSPMQTPPRGMAAPDEAPSQGAGQDTRPFGFTHVVVRLPNGWAWVNWRAGLFCAPQPARVWNEGQQQEQIRPFAEALRPEMQNAGYKVDGDPDSVFAPSASTADLQLAAVITDMHFDYCDRFLYSGNNTINGTATMHVEWQLYSTMNRAVIAKIQTDGAARLDAGAQGNFNTLLEDVFRANVDQLIASPYFRRSLTPAPVSLAMFKPQAQSAIALAGALAAKGRRLSDTAGSVVVIRVGQSEGSGFLVSSDGLLLTDQHVVGDARYVKVRWPDGLEGTGEVVRIDRLRDVALVKTDSRGRQPIRVRRDPMQPGDTVFAIGSPLGDRFQNTVTRGVVSAYRNFGGATFIQSDVSVNPGSSGGPLLDESVRSWA
jgi:serine protease Do